MKAAAGSRRVTASSARSSAAPSSPSGELVGENSPSPEPASRTHDWPAG